MSDLSAVERISIAGKNLAAVVVVNKEQAKVLLKRKSLASLKAKVKGDADLLKSLQAVEAALLAYEKELVGCRENMKALKIKTCTQQDCKKFLAQLQQDRKDIEAKYKTYKDAKAKAVKEVNDYVKSHPKEKGFFSDLLTPEERRDLLNGLIDWIAKALK